MVAASAPMEGLMAAIRQLGFALPCCSSCNHYFFPPQSFCPRCLALEVNFSPASAEGRILSSTRVDRTLDPDLASRLPIHVACVQLVFGPSLFALMDREIPAGTAVKIWEMDGLFYADSTSIGSGNTGSK